MDTNAKFPERLRHQERFAVQRRLATECLEEAQRERIRAIVEAHQSGLSVRQIAVATGLSSSRAHQILGSDEAREIPRWSSQQRRRGRADGPRQEAARSPLHQDLQARLAGELEALRRCREWLERLDRGETVVVNLRPEADAETEYVAFDRLRVLARVIADLDELAGFPPIAEEKADPVEGAEARRVRHRQRSAEPEPPKRLSRREEREARRTLLGLPPSKRH
jgi:hypothetical protein